METEKKEKPHRVNGIEKNPGVCDECNGSIVKKLLGKSSYGECYTYPFCEDCKKVYPGSSSAKKVGHQEFEDRLSQPFTT